MVLSALDLIVIFTYLIGIMGYGLWMSRAKKKNASDYFLASKSLPWWIIGGSLIASNISAEQILGTNGSGYAIGLAISGYELMSALALILVAKYFLPIFLEKNIFSIPQFLETRFDNRVRICFSFILVLLYVFINISSIFYLGGLAIENLTGLSMIIGVGGLVLYAASFSIFGGLKAVVFTDVIQAIVLMIGGFIATGIALYTLGDGNIINGTINLYEYAPERFKMILNKDHEHFSSISGISILLGGMWITNIYYWGGNQFIIQRALAAKNIKEAQKGVASAAFLKLLMPLIAVVPGMAAYALQANLTRPDEAFPWILNNLIPVGLKGLVFASLIAAIGSSISSLVNSVSTITTLDIYKPLFNENATDKKLVMIGKVSAIMALISGMVIAPILGQLDLSQAFLFIQEFTGFISPGAFVILIFGIFWKKTSANAAFYIALISIPLSVSLFLLTDIPFFYRMTISFVVLSFLIVVLSNQPSERASTVMNKTPKYIIPGFMVLISIPFAIRIFVNDIELPIWIGLSTLILNGVCLYYIFSSRKVDSKAITLNNTMFKTDKSFNIMTILIILILTAIYTFLW